MPMLPGWPESCGFLWDSHRLHSCGLPSLSQNVLAKRMTSGGQSHPGLAAPSLDALETRNSSQQQVRQRGRQVLSARAGFPEEEEVLESGQQDRPAQVSAGRLWT